ncbi:hypothetical protein SeMB42_g05468 [Synchytrium endobioticum]|uniref:separase n=1 Tax=Synchytrium endobioticum TaxID=286115 RepID=A0A507CRB1_9FUNG|nr:hypothetical protein SeMB42_g05468 [Synchytrium endobioticum]
MSSFDPGTDLVAKLVDASPAMEAAKQLQSLLTSSSTSSARLKLQSTKPPLFAGSTTASGRTRASDKENARPPPPSSIQPTRALANIPDASSASRSHNQLHCITDLCITAIATLKKSPDAKNPSFEVEPTASNIVTRLTDLGYVLACIKSIVVKPSPVQSTIKRKPTTTTTTPPTSSTASKKTSIKADTTKSNDYFIYPLETSDPTLAAILSACLYNATRCWLGRGDCENLVNVISKPHGIHHWCDRLQALDPSTGSKQSDGFFRILYRASLKADMDPLLALRLRQVALKFYVMSSACTVSQFHEYVYKFAMSFERQSKDSANIDKVLHIFYQETSTLTQILPQSNQVDGNFILWCEHWWLLVSRRPGKHTNSKKILDFLNRQPAFMQEDSATTGHLLAFNMEYMVLGFETEKSADPNQISQVVMDILKFKPMISTTANELVVKSQLRAIDGLRRAVLQEGQSAIDTCKSLLHEVSELLNAWKVSLEAKGTNLDVSKVDRLLAEILIILAKAFPQNAQKYLQSAMSLSQSNPNGLQVISSTAYNVAGVSHKNGDHESAVKLFQLSCAAINHCEKLARHDKDFCLLVAKRLDALASCQLSMSHDEEALESTEQAVLKLPDDAFTNLQEYLRCPYKSSKPDFLTRLIERLVRAERHISQSHTSKLGKNFSAVVEYEMKLLQSMHGSPRALVRQLCLIDALLNVYSEDKHPIRRSRALLDKSRVLRAQHDFNGCLSTIQTAMSLLQGSDFREDQDISQQASDDLATCNAYYGTLLSSMGRYASKPLRDALDTWQQMLQDVEPYRHRDRIHPETILGCFRDIEATYSSLRSLADYFGVLEQPSNRINALRILLKVASLRSSPATPSDVVTVYAQIGFVYVTIGSTGQAGVALVTARKILESSTCKDSPQYHETATQWKLSYANYLCAIGSIKKSAKVFGEIQEPMEIPRPRRDHLQSLAYWVKSSLSLALGNVGAALYDLDAGIKILLKACARISKGSNNADETMEKILVQASQWDLAETLSTLYRCLGRLYTIRGSPLEAQHIYRRGLSLSKTVRSGLAESAFLLALGDVELRRSRLEESKKAIHDGIERQEPMSVEISVVDSTWAKVVQGDLKYKSEDLVSALHDYADAEHGIEEAICAQIAHEDRDSGTHQQRHSGHFRRASTPRSSRFSSPNTAYSPFKAENETFVLSAVKAEVQSRVGLVLGEMGKLDDADRKTADVDSLVMKGSDCTATRAKLKLKKLISLLNGGPLYDMFGDSAFTLPWCAPLSKPASHGAGPKTPKGKAKTRNIASLAADVEEMLEEAADVARKRGRPQLVHETSHGLALLSVVLSYLSTPSTTRRTREVATEAVAVLHHAIGITARREYIDLLGRKMEVITPAWPCASRAIPDLAVDNSNQSSRAATLHSLYESEVALTADEFVEQYLSNLPSNFVVVSISADIEHGDLYITRIEKNRPPALLRLPTCRQASRDGDEEKLSFDSCKAEMETIITRSNELSREAKSVDTREGKASWWKERKELDHRLRHLLEDVETTWLGGFRGVLSIDPLPDHDDYEAEYDEFRAAIGKMLMKAVPRKNNSVAQRAKSAKESRAVDLDVGLMESLLRLGPRPDDFICEDSIYHLIDAMQYGGASVEYDELDLDGMTEDLKDALAKFHHDTDSGYTEEGLFDLDSSDLTKHLILIADKNLQSIPWESIPCLRGRSVSRLPSLSFLRDRLVDYDEEDGGIPVSVSKVSYVLNPAGDLKSTQKEFEGILTSNTDWKGIVGRPPTDQEFEDGLSQSDIFLYFGHGGGEQYLRPSRIRRMNRCGVTFLMGCSSGNLKVEGEFEPFGVALDYIFAGCPALVANLWDVTDRDIDKFTGDVFSRWGLFEETEESQQMTLSEAVGRARDTCTLRKTGRDMSVAGITADNAANHPDIEKQWAVKAMHQAETYFKLLTAVDPLKLKLTRVDDELYADFRSNFPDLDMHKLNVDSDFKSEKAKAKWRDFIIKYEKKVNDYNFGTLLRINADEEYTEENTFFVTRLQFYAVEIARNREGFNQSHGKNRKDTVRGLYVLSHLNRKLERERTIYNIQIL